MQATTATSIPTPTVNVGPLTSISQATECLDAEIVAISVDPSSTTSVEMQLGFNARDNSGNYCFPSSYMDAVVKNESPIFSPGSACPSGYKPRCTLVAPGVTLAAATSVQVWESLANGDVVVGCCPRDYDCAYGPNRYACLSTLAESETITAVYARNVSRTAQVTAGSYTKATLLALQLLYASAKTARSDTTTTSAFAQSNTPSGDKPSSSSADEGTTLNRGQIAAIIVSTLLGVVALLLCGILLYRRRIRKVEQAPERGGDASQTEPCGKPELDASTNIACVNEMDPTPRSELPESERAFGARTQQIAELEGDSGVRHEHITGKPPAINRKPVASSPQASTSDATTS
ncbi:hypothetical protein MHUMG1_09970 [Metarhizium humberi]|uniref:Uncharacterized protein n=1 Tax=Metarhizium humberi TaxID=2596975 RepID=A0A9P8M285_9HYPO|nr:hypothetical protein MHUMG1_09970 [Metarhizium humberi]